MDEPKYITPREAMSLFSIQTRPSERTMTRWMLTGVRTTKRNPRVVLRSHRVGGYVFTTVKWVEEFKIECQPNQKAG